MLILCQWKRGIVMVVGWSKKKREQQSKKKSHTGKRSGLGVKKR